MSLPKPVKALLGLLAIPCMLLYFATLSAISLAGDLYKFCAGLWDEILEGEWRL